MTGENIRLKGELVILKCQILTPTKIGVIPVNFGIVRDNPDELKYKINQVAQ